jgi:hypothetical protein
VNPVLRGIVSLRKGESTWNQVTVRWRVADRNWEMQASMAVSGTGPAIAFEFEGKMVVSLLRGQSYWDRRKMLQPASSQIKMS